MEKKEKEEKECCEDSTKKRWHEHKHSMTGGGYGLVLIGAAVYYVQQADTFWMGVWGILKAIIWPAMLAYKIFTLLHM